MVQGPPTEVSIRMPEALDVHVFNGHLQPGDQMVTGQLHSSQAATFVWHETSAARAAISGAHAAMHKVMAEAEA